MLRQKIITCLLLLAALSTLHCDVYQVQNVQKPRKKGRLVVSENNRFLQYENGKPFFWLGDTAWLLFKNLNRAEVEVYLENRRRKGFNVVQATLLHSLPESNAYWDAPLVDDNPAQPLTTPGNNPANKIEYDYWDHVDFVIDRAAEKGIYIAMLPTWGANVKRGYFSIKRARAYGKWLAKRYRNKSNVIWINGGDIKGDNNTKIWQVLGTAIHETDPNHLMSFHPFGRTQSSTWFHNEEWLDFNMFQSGHRRYDQIRPGDDATTWKGEDNWRYVLEDYAKLPPKPTIDGEPSYENIPQGLHDPNEPYWQDKDVRRYAYWSVFAGAFGHTYGNNAVMQMHKSKYGKGDYSVRNYWYEGIDEPGGGQMRYLKALILSRPFFERVFDPSLIAGENGEKYDYVIATRGESYAFIYAYTGGNINVSLGKISGEKIKAWWYNPRNGEAELLGYFDNKGVQNFDLPGLEKEGNDWVLVLDDAAKKFPAPGVSPASEANNKPEDIILNLFGLLGSPE
jgi:hypothetical protein